MTAPDRLQLYPVERDPRLRFLIPAVVAMGFTLEQIDTTVITTAIPAMMHSLHTSALMLSLAITTYVLVLGVFIPVSGWLADRFGCRKVFMAALMIFSAGSILSGLSTNLPVLVGARALQGLGGAIMTPVGRLILLRSFPREQYVTATTYMIIPGIVGPVIGPVLGGFLTTYASWRWAFFINVPFGLIGVALASRYIEDDSAADRHAFDFRGFLLFGAGIAALQYALDAVRNHGASKISPTVLFTGAVGMFVGFRHHVKRTKLRPAVDLTVFRDIAFRTGSIAGALSRMALSAIPFLLPLLLQVGFGVTPVQSGLITVSSVVGSLFIRPLMSRAIRMFGFGYLLAGASALCAVCLGGFALVSKATPLWLLLPQIIVFGSVRSIQYVGANTLAYSELPPGKLSAATGVGSMLQQLSGSFGISLAATLLAWNIGPHKSLTPQAFHAVFLELAILPILAILPFLAIASHHSRTKA